MTTEIMIIVVGTESAGKTALLLLDYFKAQGVDARMFDSEKPPAVAAKATLDKLPQSPFLTVEPAPKKLVVRRGVAAGEILEGALHAISSPLSAFAEAKARDLARFETHFAG
jgi:hypothetical protein